MHHAMTDGVAGLAILAALGDDNSAAEHGLVPTTAATAAVSGRSCLAGPSDRAYQDPEPTPEW